MIVSLKTKVLLSRSKGVKEILWIDNEFNLFNYWVPTRIPGDNATFMLFLLLVFNRDIRGKVIKHLGLHLP